MKDLPNLAPRRVETGERTVVFLSAGRNFWRRAWVLGAMRFLRAALAGLFVVIVGLFTAGAVALGALVLFIARRLGMKVGVRKTERRAPEVAASKAGKGDDVIDVEATDVTGR